MRALRESAARLEAALMDGGELETLVDDLDRRLQEVIATLQPIST
jgi:hypothetical protein